MKKQKMNILYYSVLFSGMLPFFKNAEISITGMPAFYNVFRSFLDDKDINEVVFIQLIDTKKYGKFSVRIPEIYVRKLKVIPFYYTGRVSFFIAIIRSLFAGIKLAYNRNISFIYSHGSVGSIGSLIGILTGKKHFCRVYGTFLYERLANKKVNIMKNDFFEYFTFKLPANAMIITNDGTKGDEVFRLIGNKKTPLYFLLNGIDKQESILQRPDFLKDEKLYLSYIARIDYWKQQFLLLEALNILKVKKIDFPKVYLVGQFYNKEYYEVLISFIKEHHLNNDVEITGEINRAEVQYLLKNSLATFSLYQFSNLGNVFLESIALQTPMIAINVNNSLDEIPENCYIKVSEHNAEEIALIIENLLGNKINVLEIKRNSEIFAKNMLLSWEQRVKIEKEIIFDRINKENVNQC